MCIRDRISLATPGRTCSDRVRVAVIGTRPYDERSFEADRGRIHLGRVREFRPRAYGYVIGGAGVSAQFTRSALPVASSPRFLQPTLDLGIGFQFAVFR